MPLYEVVPCLEQELQRLINNCAGSSSKDRKVNSYIFFSQKKNSKLTAFVKPIEVQPTYSSKLYGIFRINGNVFYCIGEKPNGFLERSTADSIEVIYQRTGLGADSTETTNVFDGFSDLNTIIVKKKLALGNQEICLFIQPCENFVKKDFKWKDYKCKSEKKDSSKK